MTTLKYFSFLILISIFCPSTLSPGAPSSRSIARYAGENGGRLHPAQVQRPALPRPLPIVEDRGPEMGQDRQRRQSCPLPRGHLDRQREHRRSSESDIGRIARRQIDAPEIAIDAFQEDDEESKENET